MKKHIWCIVLIIAVGIGAFFGGVYYQKSKMTTMGPGGGPNGGTGMPTGTRGQSGSNSGSMPTDGEITAVDGDTITVKTNDGGSKIVILNSSTTVSQMTETAKDKLTVGTNIMVTGTENSDKSVTAKSVQIRTNSN